MRRLVLRPLAAAMFFLPTVTASWAVTCEDLRLACEHKGALGEQGAGNCRTYRASCLRRAAPTCGQLRYWCLHKEQYGLQGAGYCATYRANCR